MPLKPSQLPAPAWLVDVTADYSSTSANVGAPLGSSAILVTLASALFVVSGYVINVVLGRVLGPTDYGLFGVTVGLITLINALQTSAVPQAIARLTANGAGEPDDLLTTGLLLQGGTGLALAGALFVLAEPGARLLGDAALVTPFRIAALALPSYAVFTLLLGFNGGRGRYFNQAAMLSLYSVVKATSSIGLGLVFFLPGAVLGYVVSPVVGLLAGGLLTLRRGRLVDLRPILSAAAPLLLIAGFSMAHLNLDLFFVKALVVDPAAAGHYTAAQAIARVPYFLMTGFTILLLPAAARAASRGPAYIRNLVREAARFGFLAVAPLAALLAGAAGPLVQLLYAEPYAPAATPLILLAPGMAAFALSSLLASLLAGAGRSGLAVGAVGAGTGTTVLLGAALVPGLGTVGAAVATLTGALVALTLGGLASVRVFALELPWLSFARGGAAALLVGAAAGLIEGATMTLAGLPLLVVAYVTLLVLLREAGPQDWRRLRELWFGRVPGRPST